MESQSLLPTVITSMPTPPLVPLRREWDSFAPISRLPPELLSLVFCHVRDTIAEELDGHYDAFDNPFAFERRSAVKDWMKISHVCHSWREVALNTVSLWSHLVVTRSNYKWAEECLRRSKGSSFVLYAESVADSHHPSRILLRELKNHMGRCRELNLRDFTTGDSIEFLSQIDTSHLIHFHYSHRFYSNSSASQRLSLPLIDDSLLRADSLRHLSISCCPIDWSASIFHRLTHLQLYYIPEESRLDCHTFISFLICMPRLEILDLCEFLRMTNSEANRGKADGTHLQHLRYVELDDNPYTLAGFLSGLPIRPFCKVLVNVEGYPDVTVEECLPILSWASNHFRPPITGSSNASDTHHNHWRSLRVFYLDSYFGFQGYTVKENLEPNKILFEHSIRLPNPGYENVDDDEDDDEDEDGDDDDDVPIFPQLLFIPLPISRIVYLEIANFYHSRTVLSKSMWINIFSSIPTLESICIAARSLPFFQALLPYDHDQDSESMPFPVLSSVIVQDDYKADYDVIVRSLRYRFRRGTALKKLVLKDCSEVASSYLKQLREAVEEVKVITYGIEADAGRCLE
jgi:hypothetical protein